MIVLTTNLKLGPLTGKGTTQRTPFPMTSMCRFGDNYLATSGSKLFSLGGNDFDSASINSYFEPITTDFGISNHKRLRYVYIGFQCTGKLQLVVTADEQTEYTYTINPTKIGQQKIRVTIDRNKKGRYWNFRIKNVSGSDFSIDSIEVLPVVLNHGFNSY